MNDFTSPFWGYYIATISLLGMAGMLWLIFVFRRQRVDLSLNTETGHVWDGDLREFNNPLPRWWVNLFIITIIFALIYVYLFPALVITDGHLRFTSAKEVRADMQQLRQQEQDSLSAYAKMPLETLAQDGKAMGIAQKAFLNNCAQCHMSDAKGAPGFPNLTDSEWKWGGTPELIEQTITEGRNGVMPSQLPSLPEGVTAKDMANYVRSLSGLSADAAAVAKARPVFETVCAACHNADGKGNQALGSNNLTALAQGGQYGNSLEAIIEGVTNGHSGTMPTQKDNLSAEMIHLLAGYVWRVSHAAR